MKKLIIILLNLILIFFPYCQYEPFHWGDINKCGPLSECGQFRHIIAGEGFADHSDDIIV